MPSEDRPLDALSKAIGSMVLVGLKSGRELRGKLASYDTHVNLLLEETEEVKSEEASKRFGKMIIRGDSVVFVSPAR